MINGIKVDKYIKDYKQLCKIFGNILDAPSKGGNISIKEDEYLIIKSSGEDLKKEHNISILKNGVNICSYFDQKIVEHIVKPSMEIGMHTVFKNKYVAHYHPVYVLPYLCSNNYNFNNVINCDVIDFVLPGDKLSKYLQSVYIYKENGIVMLKNHGVILYSENISELFDLYKQIKNIFFIKNNCFYTPDDVVDINSSELWLFRNVIENIANKYNLNLQSLKQFDIDNLLSLTDEIYRQTKMKNKD
ncbi:class II aldolase/adducin family protein [Campylobacter hepaticus]|uniref:Class II aldolase/adducin family protein n=1 Tax=Campylobacter hepaticus TaxID=1813019 RepID=A0A424YYP9_9BACT|nr:class II aldolase/adducin family protein [Campylobacter hepaticus]RQD66647.1 class II aldolase/adducin family protein [Campylobacter hepaticus]RQD86126.1 class II aldolase/adducin family protein [Campylobacter hepaticus]